VSQYYPIDPHQNSRQKDPSSDKKIRVQTKRSHLRQKDPNVELEPLPEDAYSFPQTFQTIQTNQTRAGEKTFSETTAINGHAINGQSQDEGNQPACWQTRLEQEVKQGEKLQEKNGLETIASVVEKIPRAVAQKATKTSQRSEIPQDLINKLEELEIPLDERVRSAISSHHILRAYGAAAHVERTRATIDNPRGVFLFQLPRQPIEQLGTRGKVITAREIGDYTLAHIQKMYPNNWREAAAHFGIDVLFEEGEQ
jgi:hypothetical protein